MSFELSYAGYPFPLDNPSVRELLRERYLDLSYLHSVTAIPDMAKWPTTRLTGLALPTTAWRPTPRLGQFFYPTGASRWAEFYGVVDTATKNQMIQAALPISGSPVAKNFIVKCDPSLASDKLASGGFTTPMYLIEARPLLVVSTKYTGLWMITLVDERWYWQRFKDAGTYHPLRTGATWASLFSTLSSALGITLSYGSINSVYATPSEDSSLWSNYEMAAQLLDAAAANVGMVVVRNFAGTYQLMSPSTSVTNANSQRDQVTRTAGGAMLEQDPGEKIIRTAQAILPSQVRVTFPKFVSNGTFVDTRDSRDHDKPGYGDTYKIDVTLATAGYSNYTGYSGAKVIRDTARAYLTAAGDVTPINQTELSNLATQLAKDYYAACFSQLDEVYPGIRAWTPEGASDVVWCYSEEECWTRVMRRPWDDEITDMQHECTGTAPGTSNPSPAWQWTTEGISIIADPPASSSSNSSILSVSYFIFSAIINPSLNLSLWWDSTTDRPTFRNSSGTVYPLGLDVESGTFLDNTESRVHTDWIVCDNRYFKVFPNGGNALQADITLRSPITGPVKFDSGNPPTSSLRPPTSTVDPPTGTDTQGAIRIAMVGTDDAEMSIEVQDSGGGTGNKWKQLASTVTYPTARYFYSAGHALTGTPTLNSVTLLAGDTILTWDASSHATWGVWVVAAGAWSRATTMPSGRVYTGPAYVWVDDLSTEPSVFATESSLMTIFPAWSAISSWTLGTDNLDYGFAVPVASVGPGTNVSVNQSTNHNINTFTVSTKSQLTLPDSGGTPAAPSSGNILFYNNGGNVYYEDSSSNTYKLTPSPLTTKGDLWGFSSVDTRVPISGTDNLTFLAKDSSQTAGVKWYDWTTLTNYSATGDWNLILHNNVLQWQASGGGGSQPTGEDSAISATGTTQGTAYSITKYANNVTSVSSGVNDGVALPNGAGISVYIANDTSSTLKVYPPVGSGAQINNGGANASVNLLAKTANIYTRISSTQWYQGSPVGIAP